MRQQEEKLWCCSRQEARQGPHMYDNICHRPVMNMHATRQKAAYNEPTVHVEQVGNEKHIYIY
jgi:hypothetical protein